MNNITINQSSSVSGDSTADHIKSIEVNKFLETFRYNKKTIVYSINYFFGGKY